MKQKSAEMKPVPGLPSTFGGSGSNLHAYNGSSSNSFHGLSPSLERALSLGAMHTEEATSPGNELQRLRSQLAEQEAKWKNAYEKLAKELDSLKTKGAESVVATQWRQRYEISVKDKEELSRKLDLLLQLSNEVSAIGSSVEQLFLDVEEDYKVSCTFYCQHQKCQIILLRFSYLEFAETIA